MIKWLLSRLLHHANRETRLEEFYRIKDKILTRYGKVVGHDIQFIAGKKCRSCGGAGNHPKISWETGKIYDYADCYHCWGGWYKHPAWVLLQRIQFGKFTFHKPIKKEYKINNPFWKDPELAVCNKVIEGYIEHTRTKHGKDALVILFLLYDWKGYWKRWYKAIGRGWRCSKDWWLRPRTWPNNIAHILRYKGKAIPFMKKHKSTRTPAPLPNNYSQTEDLPF